MGTAFVCFCSKSGEKLKNIKTSATKDITIEIGRIVFRSIIEAMELDKPANESWKSHLDAAYGIKYLYVGEKEDSEYFDYDYGPAFLTAIRYIRENGPPDYYPESDIELLYQQLDELENMYVSVRNSREA